MKVFENNGTFQNKDQFDTCRTASNIFARAVFRALLKPGIVSCLNYYWFC